MIEAHQQDAVLREHLRDEYAICRTVSHAWEEWVDENLERPEEAGWWWFILRCDRCKTIRRDLIEPNGDVFRRRYVYPDGYEIDEKVTRTEMRIEWARRRKFEGFSYKRTMAARKEIGA